MKNQKSTIDIIKNIYHNELSPELQTIVEKLDKKRANSLPDLSPNKNWQTTKPTHKKTSEIDSVAGLNVWHRALSDAAELIRKHDQRNACLIDENKDLAERLNKEVTLGQQKFVKERQLRIKQGRSLEKCIKNIERLKKECVKRHQENKQLQAQQAEMQKLKDQLGKQAREIEMLKTRLDIAYSSQMELTYRLNETKTNWSEQKKENHRLMLLLEKSHETSQKEKNDYRLLEKKYQNCLSASKDLEATVDSIQKKFDTVLHEKKVFKDQAKEFLSQWTCSDTAFKDDLLK